MRAAAAEREPRAEDPRRSAAAGHADRDEAVDGEAQDDAERRAREHRLEGLYAQHAPRLTRRLLLMLGDEAAAQDVVQDTFVLAFERLDELDELDDPTRVGGWLWGVARRKLQNHTRKQRRRRELWRRFGRSKARASNDTEQRVEAADLEQRLRDALASLSNEEREAFVVRHIEQRSLERAAGELDLPISTLSARARRAAEKVRAHFEEAAS